MLTWWYSIVMINENNFFVKHLFYLQLKWDTIMEKEEFSLLMILILLSYGKIFICNFLQNHQIKFARCFFS